MVFSTQTHQEVVNWPKDSLPFIGIPPTPLSTILSSGLQEVCRLQHSHEYLEYMEFPPHLFSANRIWKCDIHLRSTFALVAFLFWVKIVNNLRLLCHSVSTGAYRIMFFRKPNLTHGLRSCASRNNKQHCHFVYWCTCLKGINNVLFEALKSQRYLTCTGTECWLQSNWRFLYRHCKLPVSHMTKDRL